MNAFESAIAIRDIYTPGFEFSKWVVDETLWNTFRFADTIVFYHKEDSLEDVKRMATEREPCNIAMNRHYSLNNLLDTFGWATGAYSLSTKEKLMPNIAIYCNATVKLKKGMKNINVLNLVGYAFDSREQPDFSFIKTKEEVIQKYKEMWRFAEACAIKKKEKITKIKIYNVGGGAFAGPIHNFIEKIFEPSFLPLLPSFKENGIEVLGYDFEKKIFNGGFIPSIFEDEKEDVETTLYINAWDPWSLIGNGNNKDASLDGYWGRCSNMSVLGWSITNQHLQYLSI